MKKTKEIIFNVSLILIGIILTVLSVTGVIRSEGTGIGLGLVIIGIYALVKNIRYNTNAEYQEKVDTVENNKENKALSQKAWAITSYFAIAACAVGSIVFELMGKSDVSVSIAAAAVSMVVVYFISFIILSAKKK